MNYLFLEEVAKYNTFAWYGPFFLLAKMGFASKSLEHSLKREDMVYY